MLFGFEKIQAAVLDFFRAQCAFKREEPHKFASLSRVLKYEIVFLIDGRGYDIIG